MEQLLPQEVVDVIGDVVTHLMAEEEHPRKKDGPIVEEITEPGKEMSPEKEESDDGLDDLPDLECNVCFATFYAGYVSHNDIVRTPSPAIVLALLFLSKFPPIEFLQFSILKYTSGVRTCPAMNEKEAFFFR